MIRQLKNMLVVAGKEKQLNQLTIPFAVFVLILSGCKPSSLTPRVIAEAEAVVFYDADSRFLSKVISDNSLPALRKWPVYRTTSFEELQTPASLEARAKADPDWIGGEMFLYQITSTDRGGKRIHFLYHAEAQVLIIIAGSQTVSAEQLIKMMRSKGERMRMPH